MFQIICVLAILNMLMFAGVCALLVFTRKQTSHISEIRDQMRKLLEEARSKMPEGFQNGENGQANGGEDDTGNRR